MKQEHIKILKELKKQNENLKSIAATKLMLFKTTAINCQYRNKNLTCRFLNSIEFCHPKDCPFVNDVIKPYDKLTQDLRDKGLITNFYNTVAGECLDAFNRAGLSCCKWSSLINGVGKCSAKMNGIHRGIGPTCQYSNCKYV